MLSNASHTVASSHFSQLYELRCQEFKNQIGCKQPTGQFDVFNTTASPPRAKECLDTALVPAAYGIVNLRCPTYALHIDGFWYVFLSPHFLLQWWVHCRPSLTLPYGNMVIDTSSQTDITDWSSPTRLSWKCMIGSLANRANRLGRVYGTWLRFLTKTCRVPWCPISKIYYQIPITHDGFHIPWSSPTQ